MPQATDAGAERAPIDKWIPGAKVLRMAFAEITNPVKEKIVRYSLLGTIDEGHFYPTIEVAVAAFSNERTRAEQRREE